MRVVKLAMLMPLVGLAPIAAHADPQNQMNFSPSLKEPRYRVAPPRYVQPIADVAVVAPAPAPLYAPRAYSWTGIYVGGFAGASSDMHGPQLQVPVFGALQGNDIGFAPSNLSNSFNIDSQTYNALANGTNSNAGQPGQLNGPFAPGFTTYTAGATANGFATNGNNTGFVGVGTSTTNNGVSTATNSFAVVTPYNNLPGDRTDSQITNVTNTHRLIGVLGGEIGLRKQFGMFVLGFEADGGYLDGRKTDAMNSTGQFSNSQGANMTATAAECFAGNGVGGCGASGTNSSNGSVNVTNNGNSSFSQSIQSGAEWLGTARVSAGVAVDRALLFATGGLAYGQSNLAVTGNYRDTANSVCSGNATSPTNGAVAGNTAVGFSCNGVANTGSSFTYSNAAQFSGSRSKFMTGFALGAGAAFAVSDDVIIKLESLYYNLGTTTTTVTGTGTQTLTINSGAGPIGATPGTRPATVSSYNVSRKIDGVLAKLGVQVKFDSDPIAVPVVAARY